MKFKDRAMSSMQNFARAMFMPVLILPIVGLLIAVANLFTNASLIQDVPFLNNPVTIGFGTILSGCMQPILSNLGLIFAVGVSIGLAKEKKSDAAFISVLTYVVFLNAMNKYMNLRGLLAPADALRGTGQSIILGVQVLEMGAFLGIILGLVVAAVHNRFINTEFKGAFQIYGSARFVFIVMIPVTILLAVVCTHVWPPIQSVISKFGTIIGESGNLGYFLFGASERLLIPVGLHNVLNPMILYTSLGGSAQCYDRWRLGRGCPQHYPGRTGQPQCGYPFYCCDLRVPRRYQDLRPDRRCSGYVSGGSPRKQTAC